jgi:hypothetical protein
MAKFSSSGPTGAVGSLARSSDMPMSRPPNPESVTISFGVDVARVLPPSFMADLPKAPPK